MADDLDSSQADASTLPAGGVIPGAIESTSGSKRSSSTSSSKRKKAKTSRRTLWDTDGPTESVSSLSVLLDWLTEEKNYKKWRGGDKKNGDTKTALAKEIAERIRVNGIQHARKPKDIVTKIGLLEQSFGAASDFLANTGAGITNEASLQAAIEERCPHYIVLKGIMECRPSTRPLPSQAPVVGVERVGKFLRFAHPILVLPTQQRLGMTLMQLMLP
ncbi:hypothetical protein PF003_g10543 [Phytophthora fragariae]|nr:hypothetical protein PF003_g10543 [Phytophthora fragariae]